MSYRIAQGCYPGSIVKVVDADGHTTYPSDSTLRRWARAGYVERIPGGYLLTREGYMTLPPF